MVNPSKMPGSMIIPRRVKSPRYFCTPLHPAVQTHHIANMTLFKPLGYVYVLSIPQCLTAETKFTLLKTPAPKNLTEHCEETCSVLPSCSPGLHQPVIRGGESNSPKENSQSYWGGFVVGNHETTGLARIEEIVD